MKAYSSVYGFNVTDMIRKGRDLLLVDLEDRRIYSASTVTAAFLIEAIDDETGKYKFYVKENENESGDKSGANSEQACNDAQTSGISGD